MPPRSERNVNVVFEPAACASYRGTVVIRPAGLQPERRDVAMVRRGLPGTLLTALTPLLSRSPRGGRACVQGPD